PSVVDCCAAPSAATANPPIHTPHPPRRRRRTPAPPTTLSAAASQHRIRAARLGIWRAEHARGPRHRCGQEKSTGGLRVAGLELDTCLHPTTPCAPPLSPSRHAG